jgi:O-antigen/teichoic acid export membrane protein
MSSTEAPLILDAPDDVAPSDAQRSCLVRPNPAINIIWNWAGIGVEAAVGFVIAPLLIHGLGDEIYGLWVLIGSLSGCFGMFDFGMRGAVGRFVALHHARGDRSAVQAVLSTATVSLCGIGLAAFIAMVGMAWALPSLYAIPPDDVGGVRLATVVVGVQLALFFVLRTFDAALWAYQRFDLLNAIDMPTTILRALLIWWQVSSGGGILRLAWISLLTTVVSGAVKCWFTLMTTPGLQLRLGFATRSMLRELIGYGFWNFLVSTAAMVRSQLCPLLVGGMVGIAAVGPFSIVMRLLAMAMMMTTAATGVFNPIAIAAHARQDDAHRRRLLMEGTRLSLSLALYFLGLFVWLGKPLLSIWIRPDFAKHWPLLVIIACGEVLPMAMSVAQGVVQAMARHRRLAWFAAAETALSLVIASLLGPFWGLTGFVIALACAALLFRGVGIFAYICSLTHLCPLEVVRGTLIAPVISALLPWAVLHLLVASYPPASWPLLLAYTAVFSTVYGGCVLFGVLGYDDQRSIVQRVVGYFAANA